MDAGEIWASRTFAMREGSKSQLYRHEVTEAAIQGLLEAIDKFESKTFVPEPLDYSRHDVKGRWQASMKQADRAIDWGESSCLDPQEDSLLRIAFQAFWIQYWVCRAICMALMKTMCSEGHLAKSLPHAMERSAGQRVMALCGSRI